MTNPLFGFPMGASLETQTHGNMAARATGWYRDQLYWTMGMFPVDENRPIVRIPRRRTVSFTGLAANATETKTIRSDFPAIVYIQMGGARDASGAALPANLHPLETFEAKIEYPGSEKIDTDFTLARTILGNGEHPFHIGGSGNQINSGAGLQVTVKALRANMVFYVTVGLVELRSNM